MICFPSFAEENDSDSVDDATNNDAENDDCQHNCRDTPSLGQTSNTISDSEYNKSNADTRILT